jgi:hypothetical protein
MTLFGKQPPRHRFILNTDRRKRYASCPECQSATEERKVPLVVHVEPRNLVTVNKVCRFCPRCDLLIAHHAEVETQLALLFEKQNPNVIGNAYLIVGTLDHDVWEHGRANPMRVKELPAHLHDFRDVLDPKRGDRSNQRPQQKPKKSPAPKRRPRRKK